MKVIVESGTGKILGEYLIGAEASSLTAVAAAQVSKPPVPEFALKYVDTSYDVPQTSSIDPYTRNVTIKAGYNWTEVFSYQHSFPESPLRLKMVFEDKMSQGLPPNLWRLLQIFFNGSLL